MRIRDDTSDAPLLVVMGVAGSGKTTVGTALAEDLDVPFADADEFHSQANIAKMAAGTPLNDDDRAAWLGACARWLAAHSETGAVLSCSALRRRYRDRLRTASPNLAFIHLDGDHDVARRRVAGRPRHFMPASLVDSQYAQLEPLKADERGLVLDFSSPVEQLVSAIRQWSGRDESGGHRGTIGP